eukprot:12883112-Prorocentrum_lima.AAC.1
MDVFVLPGPTPSLIGRPVTDTLANKQYGGGRPAKALQGRHGHYLLPPLDENESKKSEEKPTVALLPRGSATAMNL